jgi:hypothetical protein
VKDYRSLETAARHVQATETTLVELGRAGWIEFVSKEGRIYISSSDELNLRMAQQFCGGGKTKTAISVDAVGSGVNSRAKPDLGGLLSETALQLGRID